MAGWLSIPATLGVQDTQVPTPRPSTTTPEIEDAVTFARTRLGFHPDPIQEQMLRANPHRVILNCCRQWGKSTVGAAVAIHRAWTRAGSTILVASPSERQSGEFVLRCRKMLFNMGLDPSGDGSNAISIAFENGSRIVGVPGKEGRIRGFSVNLMFIDEAAFVDDSAYNVLRPMLAATKGDLWLLSMPNGKRGFFYEAFAFGKNWTKFLAPGNECPRIDPEFLVDERDNMGKTKFAREYLCEFNESEDATFSQLLIDRAMDATIKPLDL